MTYQTTLTYTEPLLRRAVLGFWWRSIGVRFLIALTIVASAFTYLLLKGDASWVVGTLGTVLVFGTSFMVALFFVHYRNSLAKFRAMGSPTATFALADSAFTFSSGAGTSTLPWSSVAEVWQFNSFWLLLFSKAQFVTLPLTDVAPEIRAFIIERVRGAGARAG